MNERINKPVIFITLLLLYLAHISCNKSNDNYRVPDFTLGDVYGNNVNLYRILNQRPVLIIAWALWCKQSIEELDTIKYFANELNYLRIKTLAISVDSKRSAPAIPPFAIERNWIFYYSILLDTTEVFRNLYNLQALPTTFFIDMNGKLLINWPGYKKGDEKKIIDSIFTLFNE